MRGACKADSFYTIREEIKKVDQEPSDNWLDIEESEDEEAFEKRFVEKHYAVLPSIIFSNSENPRHKLRHHLPSEPCFERV